ncbi:major facilitator superfamily domain-containing protein [Sporodiniella umbellata]|nr:major facilitator superfamily domain-containing protein [Sporodiniella umbellata]
MDRTNISNAISDNMPENLGFDVTGVNTSTLVYSIAFTLVTLISNPIAKRVGPHRWIPFLMFTWAIATWSHVLLHNFGEFMVVRVVVAITEAGFIPSCLLYFTTWYKSSELATRLAWFWGIQAFASAFSGLISFGIFNLNGVGGLYGWKWLFLIDGIFTHIVGFIAIFYLPSSPVTTKGLLRGKNGWFDEREESIAVTRIISDDKYKLDQNLKITWHDVRSTLLDTKVWTHLLIAFMYNMYTTPMSTYFPKMTTSYGFEITTANLLTIPGYIINLVFSIWVARSADKHGSYGLHCLFSLAWSFASYLGLILLSDGAGRWSFYVVTLFAASSPSYHGMNIAWMSSNTAPHSKRVLALGAIIGAANICSVPGSQMYLKEDGPRFVKGNWGIVGSVIFTAIVCVFQHFRYVFTNKRRETLWQSLTEKEREDYTKNSTDEGSDRLDYRFKV